MQLNIALSVGSRNLKSWTLFKVALDWLDPMCLEKAKENPLWKNDIISLWKSSEIFSKHNFCYSIFFLRKGLSKSMHLVLSNMQNSIIKYSHFTVHPMTFILQLEISMFWPPLPISPIPSQPTLGNHKPVLYIYQLIYFF